MFDRCREVQADPDNRIDLWARGHYKAVDVDEPVPTPSGWRRHGDLAPGDFVFGPDGKPTRVLARTEVFTDADCYLVTFDDGYTVVVSGDHLWTVDMASRRRLPGGGRDGTKSVTIDTRSLMAEVERSRGAVGRVLPRVPIAAPIEGAEAELPIDPYALGVWLGDGSKGSNRVVQSFDDADAMQAALEACGVNVRRQVHSNSVNLALDGGVRGHKGSSPFIAALRSLGIFGFKRIPDAYLRASASQRWSLLQGLMDTDGSCDVNSGSCIFCNADGALAAQVLALASSLGLKASMHLRHGDYRGEPRQYFQVQFLGTADRPPFRLPRKVARCVSRPVQQTRYRRVVGVEPAATRPVSCIQVDRADGLYLIGSHYVTTHNSTVITFALTIMEILNDPELTFGIFSFSRPIAKQFLRQIKQEFEQNALLKWAFDDILWESPSQAPKWSEDDGIVVKRRGNPKESTVEAWGLVDGQPTSKHFKRMIYDDVVTDKSVTTPEQIKKTTAAFGLSRNLVSKGSRTRIIGTRYHYFDTYSELMKRGFIVRKYAATKDCTLNGPGWILSPAELLAKQIEMQDQFAPQMMQEPRLDKDAYFKPSWWKRFKARPRIVNHYIGCDLAVTKAGGDYTVFVVIAIDENGDLYVVDLYRSQEDTLTWALELIRLIKLYKPMAVGVPVDQISKGAGPFLRKLMLEKECYPNLVEMPEAGADKVMKARSFQGLAAMGKVYLPALEAADGYLPPEWLGDLDAELLFFPMAEHDDQVDSLSIIGRMLEQLTEAHVPTAPKKTDPTDYAKSDEDNYEPEQDPMLA